MFQKILIIIAIVAAIAALFLIAYIAIEYFKSVKRLNNTHILYHVSDKNFDHFDDQFLRNSHYGPAR